MRRAASALAAAVTVVLAGCSAPVQPAASYVGGPCPNPVVPGYPQLDIPAGVECGYLTVPESRAEPGGRSVRLAVARAKATAPDPRPDPLVYLTGGPGGTAMLSVAQKIAAGWNTNRDVIFLEQRGTAKSAPPLTCPEVDAFQDAWLGLDTADPATARRSADAAGACHDRLAPTADLASYDTAENSADVADLRTALGVDEWNVYGVSYGSNLALQTLRDHPEGIRSVVVDSVVPPQQGLGQTWASAASALTAVVDACAAQPTCRAAHPALRADLVRAVTELAARPRPVTLPDPATGADTTVLLDGSKVVTAVIRATTAPGGIAEIPRIVENIVRGDGTLAAALLLDGRGPSGLTGWGLLHGVSCGEFAGPPDALLAGGRAAFPELPDQVLSLVPQAPFTFADCVRWPVPPVPDAVRTPVTSDVPVLVMTGAFDGATAPTNGDLVARTLSRAVRVNFPDAGHDVTNFSPQCAVPVIHSFLDRPDAPDLTCVAALAAPTFS